MATPGADGKQLANSDLPRRRREWTWQLDFPHSAKKYLKSATPKFDFAPYDVGMVVLDIGLAMATRRHACQAGDTPRGHIEVNGLIRTATRWPL